MRWAPALALMALAAGVALAEAPATSVRPLPRPPAAAPVPDPVTPDAATVTLPAVKATTTVSSATQRPAPRPSSLHTADPAAQPASDAAQALPLGITAPAVAASLRPKPRPKDLVSLASASAAAAPTAKSSKKSSRKGSVCGDPDIRGEELAAIKSKTKGCGLAEPVKITMIDDVALNPAATISCGTADALKQWIELGMAPAFGNRKVVELKVAASYICRTRNNVKSARVSEHGRGNAIDIAGFVMSDGTTWTIAQDYNKTIRKAHKAACGIFGTTLGPGSDGYHEDHLHFDIAYYANGSYCR